MPVFADNFLAGSLISLLMPVALLITIWVWYWLAAKRFGPAARARRDAQAGAPEPPVAATGSEGSPPAGA